MFYIFIAVIIFFTLIFMGLPLVNLWKQSKIVCGKNSVEVKAVVIKNTDISVPGVGDMLGIDKVFGIEVKYFLDGEERWGYGEVSGVDVERYNLYAGKEVVVTVNRDNPKEVSFRNGGKEKLVILVYWIIFLGVIFIIAASLFKVGK